MENRNIYKGHRYVPKIMGEWVQEETYEGLSIVTHEGTSFTSKKRVPVGIDILDEEYWVVTGNYNAQVDNYRQEVRDMDNRVSDNESGIENTNTHLVETDNVIDVYVSPENFNSLNECIEYAKENKKIIKADYVKLVTPANFRGVGLEINELEINGHSIILGDYNGTTHNIVEGTKPYRPSQSIEIIYGRNGWDSEVFIKGASYQTIKIGTYSGNIQLVVNRDQDSNFIAYNEFYFRNVRGVKIRTEETEIDTLTGWVNENKFYMMNTRIFIMGNKNGYNHNNNFIYGGCFEGNSLIEIVSGSSNYFYDIRAEQNLKIRFHERASRNNIQLSLTSYLATVRDDSLANDNVVINPFERNMRIKHHHSISTNDTIGGNESGYNMRVDSPFKNFRFEEDEKVFKPISRTTGSGNNILYVSPFLSDPKNIQVLVESHFKEGGLGIGYKLYDENYNDITNSFAQNGFDPYMIMTHDKFVDNHTNEGMYRGVSNYLQIRTNTDDEETLFRVENDIIMLAPAGTWKLPEVKDRIEQVAYVKFFIGHTGVAETCSLYDMTITIYDITGNYHKRYFGNQARSLEWTQPAG